MIDNILWFLSFYAPGIENQLIERFKWHERKSVQSRRSMISSPHDTENTNAGTVFGFGNDLHAHLQDDQYYEEHHHRPTDMFRTDLT